MMVENPFIVPMDVPFKPYTRVRRAYQPKKSEHYVKIPERYTHTLLLRRKISLHNIAGFVDVISEDPNSIAQMMANNGHFNTEKPFDEVSFVGTMREEDGTLRNLDWEEEPYILRFGFPLHNPAEYARLLNTYVDVRLGKERYMAAWNLSTPAVARRMQRLEEDNEIIVKEKNLFNLNAEVLEALDTGFEGDIDFSRITFIWLAPDAKKLRAIELTFHQFFDDDEQPAIPIFPEKELVIARA